MEEDLLLKKSVSSLIYNKIFKPLVSQDEGLDAEKIFNFSIKSLSQLSIRREWPLIKSGLLSLKNELKLFDNRLSQNYFGCHFANPIGLAAGFDKDGVAAGIWEFLGFGYAELGTTTFHPQFGNAKPRLFRLAKEKGALNRMGFNNNGAADMKKALIRQKIRPPGKRPITLGINIGKSKICNIEDAADDYASSLEILASLADYAVINISSPNTSGLRKLQEKNKLRNLIRRLKVIPYCPPLLIKIAPDLEDIQIDELSNLAMEESLAGVIAVNTSINRLGLEKRVIKQTGLRLDQEQGGLSGDPICQRANEVVKRIYLNKIDMPIIGVGGIRTARSAWERITSGASLIQIYTGWIYQGPSAVPIMLQGLINQIEKHGFKNISDAVGSEAPWI